MAQKTFILFLILINFISCKNNSDDKPSVKEGVIDLSKHYSDDLVILKGDWKFISNKFVSPYDFKNEKSEYLEVPSRWELNNGNGIGTYQLKIILPKNKEKFAIKLLDISSAYKLFEDSNAVLEIGEINKIKSHYKPQYKHLIYNFNSSDTLLLTFQVCNFENFEGGILSAPEIGEYESLNKKTEILKLIGFVFIGSLIAFFIFQLGLGIFRGSKLFHIYLALCCIFYSIHLFCLNERLAYLFIDSWSLVLKLEIFAVVFSVFFASQTIKAFFSVSKIKILERLHRIILILFTLIILFTPIDYATRVLDFTPFYLLISYATVLTVSVYAFKEKKEGSTILLILNSIMLILIIVDNVFLIQHVGGLMPAHAGYFLYTIYLTVFLSKQTANTYHKVETLSQNLINLNSDLEEQNQNLERIVNERTEQLKINEKKTYELLLEKKDLEYAQELENKQRDIEAVKLNNQLKQEITKKMVIDLEIINQANVEIKTALKKFIAEIKQQYGLSEKLNTLEQGIADVNAEFYDRLTLGFPTLTKTERELCSLIKLNLSNKEISYILQTTPNALHAKRSRIRKKMNIPKEIDIEVL